jgi:hypothetical protein
MFSAARVALSVLAVSSLSAKLALGAPVRSATVPNRDAAWRRGFELAFAVEANRVPLFARQTNRMCSACHVNAHYAELTEMGRTFKLNAYRLTKVDSLGGDIQENTAGGRKELLLNLVPVLGFMVQTSYTATQKAQPGTQNGTALLPDQLSLFLGGRFSPQTGGFIQITYDPQAGTFGMDNVDLRFADSARIFSKNALVGVSVNNNPTVQDLWNSTPAWSFPWASSSMAPTPAAATLIDGTLAQQVVGVSVNTMWNRRIFGEVGVYRSAVVGHVGPLDSTSSGTISGVASYWRVALPRSRGNQLPDGRGVRHERQRLSGRRHRPDESVHRRGARHHGPDEGGVANARVPRDVDP